MASKAKGLGHRPPVSSTRGLDRWLTEGRPVSRGLGPAHDGEVRRPHWIPAEDWVDSWYQFWFFTQRTFGAFMEWKGFGLGPHPEGATPYGGSKDSWGLYIMSSVGVRLSPRDSEPLRLTQNPRQNPGFEPFS